MGHVLRYGFVLSTLWLELQTVSSLERCMSLCPLVRFHLIVLYSSGTVVGATERVWPGIRAVGSSKNTTELLIDACQEER